MNHSWHQTNYRLRHWWPNFENRYIESRYHLEKFSVNGFAIARGILVLALFFSLFSISDQYVLFVIPEAKLFSVGVKFTIGLVGFACYVAIIKNMTRKRIYTVVNFFLAAFLFALFVTFYIYSQWLQDPATLFELAICCSFLTILIYIFVPLSLGQQVVTAFGFVVLFALSAVFVFPDNASRLGFSTTFLLLANTIGLSISYTINKNFREAWSNEQERERDNMLLKVEIDQRKKLEQQLKKLAMTDALTGVDNRRSFMEHLSREKKRADRQFTPLSIITFDIDLFKHINDQFGHEVGDKVLIDVASTVDERLRETDILGRIGGEEFAILMADSNKREANQLAKSLCKALSDHAVIYNDKAIKVTASFGTAEYQTNEPIDILLRRADKAMYDAKSAGRNCVSDKSD